MLSTSDIESPSTIEDEEGIHQLVPRYQDLKGEPLKEIQDLCELQRTKKRYDDKIVLILVWVSWHRQCQKVKEKLEELALQMANFRFFWIDPDKHIEVVERFNIESVPALILLKPCGSGWSKFEGLLLDKIEDIVADSNEKYIHFFQKEKFKVYDQIEEIMRAHLLVVCIKGTKEQPKCPHSKEIIDYLVGLNLHFHTYNIQEDWRIHQWLKFYAETQEFPQIYIKGKFVTTARKLKEIEDIQDFIDSVPPECKRMDLLEKIKLALRLARLVVFMNGSLFHSLNSYSKHALQILEGAAIRFTAFDVDKDPELRDYIKEYTGYDHFPQIFFDGQFFGGREVLRDLQSKGQLRDTFPLSDIRSLQQNSPVHDLINRASIVLFMKGSPDKPQCGYSSRVVKLLKGYDYLHFDIQKDFKLKEEVKAYSRWNTFPQLYVKGNFVGGADILQELNESGELTQLLAKASE